MPTAVATTATGLLPRPVTPRRTSRRGVSEDRLIAGLRRRDPDALAQAHRDYGGAVLGCLRRMIGDPGGAEDVHQEVFLEVWRRGPSFDPSRATLATWILLIARSRAIDRLRPRVMPNPATSPPSGPRTDSAVIAARLRSLTRWLSRAVSSIAARFRSINS